MCIQTRTWLVEYDRESRLPLQISSSTRFEACPRQCPTAAEPTTTIEFRVRQEWTKKRPKKSLLLVTCCLRTCIRCRSMTAAESLLMGRGVLFTTTRRIHCSHLWLWQERIMNVSQSVSQQRRQQERPWMNADVFCTNSTYTTRSSCETKPKSWRDALLSKKLNVRHP